MIRGVNRQIVEMSETGHPYFERAFLVVREDCEDTGEGDGLRQEANRFVAGVDGYSGLRLSRRRRTVQRVLGQLASGVLGAVIGALVALAFQG